MSVTSIVSTTVSISLNSFPPSFSIEAILFYLGRGRDVYTTFLHLKLDPSYLRRALNPGLKLAAAGYFSREEIVLYTGVGGLLLTIYYYIASSQLKSSLFFK